MPVYLDHNATTHLDPRVLEGEAGAFARVQWTLAPSSAFALARARVADLRER